jgi:hypothetical protein
MTTMMPLMPLMHRTNRMDRMYRLVEHTLLLVAAAALLTGCSTAQRDVLTAPQPLVAPYDTRAGEVTWAVATPINESATSTVDPLQFGDSLCAAVEETRGLRCIPMNRTVMAMRELKLHAITTPAQARQLATLLGADAVLVTSITAYDPYTPEIGVAAALFARPGAMVPQAASHVDPRTLSRRTTESASAAPVSFGDRPASVISEHLDGRNHQVLLDLQTYACGRQQRDSALGWRNYLTSMPMYLNFAAYRTTQSLLDQEWIRVGATPPTTDNHKEATGHQGGKPSQTLAQQADK